MQPAFHEVSPDDEKTLEEIGRLRIEVWKGEAAVAPDLLKTGVWLDPQDRVSLHWIARDEGGLIAAGRLAVFADPDESLDAPFWRRAGKPLRPPLGDISRLVVHPRAQGRGVGSELIRLRIEKARALGARQLIVTASPRNRRLLFKHGFVDTGILAEFPDRPGFLFHGLELHLTDGDSP